MQITLREAVPEDARKISLLISQITYPVRKNTGRRVQENKGKVKKRIMDGNCISVVAEVDGEVVGYARGILNHKKVSVERVVVDSNYRNMRIGTRILTELERLLNKYKIGRGIKTLLLYAFIESHNIPSYNLFRKTGYGFRKIRENKYTYHQAYKRL